MSTNNVFLASDDIVEIHVIGDQTHASVESMGEIAFGICTELRSTGKRALILDNLLDIGEVPPEARQLVVKLCSSDQFDRFAMVGSGALIRFGANLMLHATGRGSRVKYFDNLEKARQWLLSA